MLTCLARIPSLSLGLRENMGVGSDWVLGLKNIV